MKSGKTLQQLAIEVERQAKSQRDFLADTRKLQMVAVSNGDPTRQVVLNGVGGGMALRPIAHGQLAETLKIPKPYYDRMLAEQPDLLAANVNRWLENQPKKKLVRTMDGEVRAILSDSYRTLSNLDLMQTVLPKLFELKAQVISGEITESRIYIKAVTNRIQGLVKVGELVQAGSVVSNSEVGFGKIRVDSLDYTLSCTNGMIREIGIKRAHIGRRAVGEDDGVMEYLRDETRAADDKAFFLKVRDTVAAMFDPQRFEQRLELYRNTEGRRIEAPVADVVEVTAERFNLNEAEKSSVLDHLIRGGDMSQWGLSSAITRMSQDVTDYDRATELEVLGGQIIELSPSDWKVLAA